MAGCEKMLLDLRTALHEGRMTGDGAMGTYLYQLGFPVGISYEELNLVRPEVIADVHKRYLKAGARLIGTNTYMATRDKLSRFGLDNEVKAINQAGVRIAREAVGKDAYVVGTIGSIRGGKRHTIALGELMKDYNEQLDALLEESIDGLLLETFFDLEEMLAVVKRIREISHLPVIAQFAIEDTARLLNGHALEDAFRQIVDSGADVVGLNCRSGPNTMLRTLEQITLPDVPVSVFPNAGIPDYVDGEYMYMAPPEYFADSAKRFARLGVRLMGGCCGTTPEHIAAIDHSLKAFKADGKDPIKAQTSETRVSIEKTREAAEVSKTDGNEQPSILEAVARRHTVIVELDPPKDLSITKFMEGAKALQDAKADALTMADNSLAVTRMSNMALGALVKQQIGIRPLIHIACRDRNLIGTQSHMMGLNALGIDHVLAVTGDPARFGDLPGSSSVYDTTSFEIIRMIKQLNEGISFSGKPLKQKANFIIGAAFNPNVRYLDRAVKRMEKKIAAGADYIMTQPVYDTALIREMADLTKHISVPIFIGIAPLASGGNAEYLHNEVPGIQLSDEVRTRMRGLKGAEGRAMGVQISKELLDTAMRYFNGIYLMTPFMSYEMTVQLTNYVWEKAK